MNIFFTPVEIINAIRSKFLKNPKNIVLFGFNYDVISNMVSWREKNQDYIMPLTKAIKKFATEDMFKLVILLAFKTVNEIIVNNRMIDVRMIMIGSPIIVIDNSTDFTVSVIVGNLTYIVRGRNPIEVLAFIILMHIGGFFRRSDVENTLRRIPLDMLTRDIEVEMSDVIFD